MTAFARADRAAASRLWPPWNTPGRLSAATTPMFPG
jgi:hypothetical protein